MQESFLCGCRRYKLQFLTISEKQNDFAEKVTKILQKRGIRGQMDLRNEKIGFKIREHTLQKIPYLLVIGDKEVESNQVAVRTREGVDLGVMTIDTICDTLTQEIVRKGSNN